MFRPLMISTLLVAFACACQKKEPSPKQEAANAVEQPQAKAEKTPAASAGGSDPCAVLSAPDFESVGLKHGKSKRESNMADGGCTWDAVLGSGGFLHFEFMTANAYVKRKERLADRATTVNGIGDEAFVSKALVGHAIHVKKGDKYFKIDGNAQLTQQKLEPLARAVVGRI